MATPPPPQGTNPAKDIAGIYTVQLPGVQDFIKIPGTESPALYYERIKRMKEANTGLPESMRWIPKVIATLDDAQDLLFTALYLAKPLIKRLPSRLIPYVGWLLTINDILNLGVFIAGTALNGPTAKSKFARTIDAMTGGTKRNFAKVLLGKMPIKQAGRALSKTLPGKVDQFVKGNQRFAAIMQGGQAAYTVTSWAGRKAQELDLIEKKPAHWNAGTGLQLGAAMGAITDSIWGGIQSSIGGRVEFTGPPQNDIGTKAARYMLNAVNLNELQDALSPNDHMLLIAASAVAADALANVTTTEQFIDRFDSALNIPPPTFRLWNPTAKAELNRWGIDADAPVGTLIPTNIRQRTLNDLILRATTQQAPWETAMASVFGPSAHGTVAGLLNQQAGEDFIATAINAGDPGSLSLSPEEAIEIRATDWNIYPLPWPSNERAEQLLRRNDLAQYQREFNPDNRWQAMCIDLADYLTQQRRVTPTPDEIKAAMVKHWGGWQAR